MINNLHSINKKDSSLFGSKAAYIGELIKHDIPAPPGFALSVSVFRQFCEKNNINFNPDRFLSQNAFIQQQLLKGTFTSEQKKKLTELFHNLYDKNAHGLVVRSSALCEDSEKTSFAGIFETFPGIHTPEGMLDAVKQCYASLLTDKALAYTLANDIPLEKLQMGIIIQQFIQGRPSGITFTADTVNMDPDIMVITWVDDICEVCVNGTAQSRQLRIKKTRTLPDNTNGLTPKQLANLIEYGHKCEQLFKAFQDIEWTFSGNTLYILQSRPVTTFKQPHFPLSWENKKNKEYTWYRVGGPVYPLDREKTVANLEAFNKGAFQSGMEWFYEDLIYQNGYHYTRRKTLPGAERKRQEYAAYVNDLKKEEKNIFTNIYLPRILEIHNELKHYTDKRLTNTELADFLDASFHAMCEINGMHWLIVQGCLEQDTLKELRENYGLASHETVLMLHQETWQTKYSDRLFHMIRLVKSDPELYQLFREHSCAEVIYAHLTDKKHSSLVNHPAAVSLSTLMDDFLKDFGLSELSWNDQRIYTEVPSTIAGQIRQFLDRNINAYFATRQKQVQAKEALTASLSSRLGRKKWEQLQSELPYLRKSYLVRDNHSYYIDTTAGGYYRLACVFAGRRLCEQGKIDRAEDFVFLYRNEIKQALVSRKSDVRSKVDERKKIYEDQKTLFAPAVIGKKPAPAVQTNQEKTNPILNNVNVLKGFSGLAAVVEGEVRFKKDISSITGGQYIFVFKFVREIDFNIILPYTKGLVFEYGSPFEHVGIWARENNIPALFGVPGIADILETGDTVKLDGINEKLMILNRCNKKNE